MVGAVILNKRCVVNSRSTDSCSSIDIILKCDAFFWKTTDFFCVQFAGGTAVRRFLKPGEPKQISKKEKIKKSLIAAI